MSTSSRSPLTPAPLPNRGAAIAVDDIPEVLPAEPASHQIRNELLDLPAVLPAEPATDEPLSVLPVESRPPLWYRTLRFTLAAPEWIFGVGILIVGLAILASLPILQFLSLGYLLEATGRAARSGRIRDGFPGIRKAARLGAIVLGTYLVLLPLQFVSSYYVSAQVIDPDGPIARAWKVGLFVLSVLVALHVALACARALAFVDDVARGKRHVLVETAAPLICLALFFWPFNCVWLVRRLWRGGFYAASRDAVWDFAVGLRLPYYFWLGLRGFVGAFAWLAIPVTLLALGRFVPPLGFLGAFALMAVLLYMPALQAQFACEKRLAAHFQFLAARQAFRRAPWAFALAFFVTLLFAVPLYLLKIEIVPREAAALPGVFFIAFMFPARVLTGWAMGRARKRTQPRHWFFRWTGRFAMIPVTILFVIIVFFTQYLSWSGVWSLYEQHAFLLPVPFVGM